MSSDSKGLSGWFQNLRHRRNRHQWTSKLVRLIYYRLIMPIKRQKDSPHIIAYGAFFGLMVGFTPTVGAQMPIIFIVWWLCRSIFRFHFSLILAIAWSWLSNPATMVPLYFMYYKTGLLFLPADGDRLVFDKFKEMLLNADTDSLRGAMDFVAYLWDTIGVSIWIGCIPYALIFGLAGYWFSLSLANGYQKIRAQRRKA